MIDKEIARGELVELLADKRLPVEMPFSAVYYSDRAVSTRIRAFIDFLSEYIRTAPVGAVKEGVKGTKGQAINPTQGPDLPD